MNMDNMKFTMNEIKSAFRNFGKVDPELLTKYKARFDQLGLLIKIMAQAQGLSNETQTDEDSEFAQFVRSKYYEFSRIAILAAQMQKIKVWEKKPQSLGLPLF